MKLEKIKIYFLLVFFFLQYNYFSYREFQLGRQLLEKSADSGHPHSIYALGMILLSEKESQLEAIKLLKKIDNVETTKCRRRSKKVLNRMWLNHFFLREDSSCMNSSCRNGGKRGLPTKEEWPRKEEDHFCSEECKWSFEFYLLCKEVFVIY